MRLMSDLDRMRAEYARRERRLAGSDIYSNSNPAQRFMVHQRRRAILQLLRQHGSYPLDRLNILEIGCGHGDILTEWLAFGPTPSRLHGTDLLCDRVADAHSRLPILPLTCADGQHLPYVSG